MKKISLFIFFILFFSCEVSQFENGNGKEINLKGPSTFLIFKGQDLNLLFSPDNSGIYQIRVSQCNIDIEVQFKNSEGNIVKVDSPTGRHSDEIFLIKSQKSHTNKLKIYSIDTEISSGYIEVSVEPFDKKFALKYLSANHSFFAGYKNQYIPNRKKIEQSIIDFKSAIDLYQEVEELAHEADASSQLGVSYHRIEKYNDALRTHFRSLFLYQSIFNEEKIAHTYNEIAASFHELRDMKSAIFYYHKSNNIYQKLGIYSNTSNIYGNISYLYHQNSQHLLQKYFLDLSLKPSYVRENSFQEFVGFHKLGLYYFSQGNSSKSLEYQKKALSLAEKLGFTGTDIYIYTIINIADSYISLSNPESAEKYALRALSLCEKAGRNNIIGSLYFSLGEIAFVNNDFSKSKSFFLKSLEFDLRDSKEKTLLRLGVVSFQIYLETGNQNLLSDSLSYLEKSLDLDPKPWSLIQIFYWKTRIQKAAKLPIEITLLERSLSIIENQRLQVQDNQTQSVFFGSYSQIFGLYLEILIEQIEENGAASTAPFYAAEKIRARTLLDAAGGLDFDDVGLPTLEEVQEYHRLLFEMEAQFHDDEAIAAMEAQLVPLAIKMERLDPTAHVVEPEAIQSADAIVEAIDDPETLLVSYAFGLEDLYLLALDATGLKVHNLGSPEALESQVASVHQYLKAHPLKRNGTNQQMFDQTLVEISERLLKPLGDLSAKKRLVFIPDRFLQLVPFGVLPLPTGANAGQPLLSQFETAVLPSASVWKALKDRSSQNPPPTKTIALMADPVFNQADARLRGNLTTKDTRPFLAALPQTKKEAEAIAKLVGQEAHVVSGFAASREFATSQFLNEYRYLHFATHTEIDTENPNRSGLIFSRFNTAGQPVDGAMRLSDISQLDLRASLVTLSACETAQGKMVRGEGLMSLARGFMEAGVPRVVGTLWKVPDDATSQFMIEFYEGLLKRNESPAQALRLAQQALQNDSRWQDPHFWAGFILIGDWQ